MIPIKNIYYMLAYAFKVLNNDGYKKIATEHFDNIAELYASILAKGMASQIKRGIGREYLEVSDSLSSPRGKIEMAESIKSQTMYRKQLICTYDEFTINCYRNQVIKTTINLLFHSNISKVRKKELRKVLVYLVDVDLLDVHSISWKIQYDHNNQTYQMLIAICFMVIKGLLQTSSDGTIKVMDFLDDQNMFSLYQRFVFEYYRQEFPQLSVKAPYIPWAIDNKTINHLPTMKSDIVLKYNNTVLIIDTKYYAKTLLQSQHGTMSQHSANMYQIFTYVKNMECSNKEKPHTVSGMLLYARTDEEEQPNDSYLISGNRIDVKTLDLNCDFSYIELQLNSIVEDFFGFVKVS